MFEASTLLLTRNQVASLANTGDYLDCIRCAFIGLADRRYSMPAVSHVDGQGGTVHIKAAVREGPSARLAIKLNANFPRNIERGIPTIQGCIALIDAENGALLALMDTVEITARRTAAATALAAKYLARPGSTTLGIIGCGVQARYQVQALLDILPIAQVKYCDLRDAAAEKFEAFLTESGLGSVRCQTPREAALHADVVVTLTPSTQPVLALADVASGTFVAGVGADNASKNELAADLLQASRVVVDRLAQASVMGDLHHAIRNGALSEADIHGELADIVAGTVAGRTNESQRFVFDSTGMAIQDLAAAEMLYERALTRCGVRTIAFDDVV